MTVCLLAGMLIPAIRAINAVSYRSREADHYA
jgi:hypothetical protein